MIMFGGGACIIPFLNLFNPSKNVGGISPATHNVSAPPTSEIQPSSPDSNPALPSSENEHILKSQQKTLSETQQIQEQDNCQFKAESKKVTASELIDASTNYIYFSCDNKGQQEEVLTSTWDVWVPKALLQDPKISLSDGQRVKIKTVSSKSELGSEDFSADQYVTKFYSDIFSARPITGTWGGLPLLEEESNSDYSIYKVTITDPKTEEEALYLRWYF